jgi:WD40 repeat protein
VTRANDDSRRYRAQRERGGANLIVFISSTSEFFHYPQTEASYAKKAHEAVLYTKNRPAHMQFYGPQNEPASAFDIKQVQEADVYIGILGPFFGTPVPSKPDVSHTMQEYYTAKEAGIEKYVFILNEASTSNGIPHAAWPQSDLRDRQQTFLNSVCSEILFEKFDNPEDLGRKVERSLWKYYLKLLREERGRQKFGIRNPCDSTAFREMKRAGFVGREWLFEKVRTWARDGSGNAAQALLIVGDNGVGKTAFLAELIDSSYTGITVAAHYFCTTECGNDLSPGEFVRSIASQLLEVLPPYRLALEEDESLRNLLEQTGRESYDHEKAFITLRKAVLAPLLSIDPQPLPHLLIVDALDEAQGTNSEIARYSGTIVELLERYARHLPSWLKVLATSRPSEVVERLIHNQSFTKLWLEAEDMDHQQDLQRYIEIRCKEKDVAKRVAQVRITPEEIPEFVTKASKGKFLMAKLILDDKEFSWSEVTDLQSQNLFPAGIDDYYKGAFGQRFPSEQSYETTRVILGVLCVAGSPLQLKELASILVDRVDDQEIQARIQELLEFLSELISNSSHETAYSISHSSLSQWLRGDKSQTRPRSRFLIDQRDAENLLDDWALNKVKARDAHNWPYLVSNLTSRLLEEEKRRYLPLLLQQPSWFRARATSSSGGIAALRFDLLNHCDADSAFKEIAKTLEQAEPAFNRAHHVFHSELLASQLLARLDHTSNQDTIRNLRDASISWLKDSSMAIPLIASLRNRGPLLHTRSILSRASCLQSLDDSVIFFGDEQGVVRSWNLDQASDSYNGIRDFHPLDGIRHNSRVTNLLLVSDLFVATTEFEDKDHRILIWSVKDLTLVKTLFGHESHVNALTVLFQQENQKLILVSGSEDSAICFWDTDQWAPLTVNMPSPGHHTDLIRCLATLSNNDIISGSKDKSVRVWRLNDFMDSAELLDQVNLSADVIYISASLKEGPPLAYAVTYCEDTERSAFYEICMNGHQCNCNKLFDVLGLVSSLSVSKPESGAEMLCYTLKGSSEIYAYNSEFTEHITVSNYSISCIYSAGSRVVGSLTKNRNSSHFLHVWDLANPIGIESRNDIATSKSHQGCICRIQSDRSGVYTFADDGSVGKWGAESRTSEYYSLTHLFASLDSRPSESIPRQLAMIDSHGEEPCVVALVNESLERFGFSALGGDPPRPKNNESPYSNEAKDPCRLIKSKSHGYLIGTTDGMLYTCKDINSNLEPRFKITTGEVVVLKEFHESYIVCHSHGEPALCIYDLNRPIAETRKDIRIQLSQGCKVNDCVVLKSPSLSANRFKFVTANQDKTIRILPFELPSATSHPDSQTLGPETVLKGHKKAVTCLEALNDNFIASGSEDREILLWSLEHPSDPYSLFLGDHQFTSLHYIKAKKLLLAGDASGRVHWLDLSKLKAKLL